MSVLFNHAMDDSTFDVDDIGDIPTQGFEVDQAPAMFDSEKQATYDCLCEALDVDGSEALEA